MWLPLVSVKWIRVYMPDNFTNYDTLTTTIHHYIMCKPLHVISYASYQWKKVSNTRVNHSSSLYRIYYTQTLWVSTQSTCIQYQTGYWVAIKLIWFRHTRQLSQLITSVINGVFIGKCRNNLLFTADIWKCVLQSCAVFVTLASLLVSR